ncbi:Organellar oligopeptidase A, chloroplastic/mitochondrial [Symbiodinium microadriaticum]|uniref:Organellar oligopeptidase A, chloroplastic/mitochondrial n=1 Tax=Symbiodinium microadriaticum TaxID=2951 RepID=A0A1Q9EPW4_SYMMI|nr:Organellar oligopeptidase A, chloroplastic/mitochondrial [Symbiodinium microadriaticum]
MDLETSPARPRGRRYRWPCAAVPLALGAGAAAFASGATGSTRPSGLRQTGLRPPGLAARPPGRTYELQQKRAVDIETKVLTHKIQRGVDPSLFNPLFEEMNGVPCLDKVKEYHLEAAMDMVLEQFSKDVSRIHNSLFRKTTLKPKQLTFEEVFNPLEVCLDRVEKTWGAISLLRKSWRPSPEVDEIYHGLSYRVATAAGILSQSEILHQALYQLLQLSEGDLSEAQYRVARRVLWEGVTMGVEVADHETMRALDEGNKQLGYLSTVFAENLAHSEAQTLALRTERLSVEGLPEEVLRAAAAAASASGQEATAEDGPWLFTCQRKGGGALGRPVGDEVPRRISARFDLSPCPANDAGKRGTVVPQLSALMALLSQMAFWNHSGNLDVIAAMLEHRQFWATTLGFPNYADLAFESRMSTREEVEALLGVLREAGEAASKDELQELQEYAAEKGFEGELKAWDLAYWRRALIQERSDFQDADLMPYLPLPAVLRGLFSLLEHLFGVSFEAATGRREVPLWHRSIRFFRLVDRELQFPFAGLYLDMFQHDEKLPSPDGGFTAVHIPTALAHHVDFRGRPTVRLLISILFIWQRCAADINLFAKAFSQSLDAAQFAKETRNLRSAMRLRVEIPLLASVLANALASETGSREAAERLSPLAQSIISMTLSSAGNPTVMRRDVSGHGQVDGQEKLAHVREQLLGLHRYPLFGPGASKLKCSS